MRTLTLTALALALIGPAAAHAREKAPPPPPSVTAAPGKPAPPQARFYADCIAQAAAAHTYDRDAEANLLRFTCTGEPARAFHDGLAAWSAQIGSQLSAEGRTWRFTQKIRKNPFGLDYCSLDLAGGDARCVVVLNVGEFLAVGAP